jgi:arsenate reductase-like glutaredoxin family protein
MKVKISAIKANSKNPRVIKDDKFKKLVKSIQEFPEMLEKRPLVCYTDVDGKYVVLGGNMRLKAANEVGLKEIPIVLADDWTQEQRDEFLIKDNVGFGEWNWDDLANEWDAEKLTDWGLDVWQSEPDVDYNILNEEEDGDDLQDILSNMTNGVKKAIQIEFEAEHYDEAAIIVKFWRERDAYIGGMILEYLKAEKSKL